MKQNGVSGYLLNVIIDFLNLRKQKVVLNEHHSTWINIVAGVSQGSILGPLYFLTYINELSVDLTWSPKLFRDDTSLFFVVQNISSKAANLNSDLNKISDWATQWKMNLNPEINKQAQEVIFGRKISKINHPPLLFNQNLVKSSSTKKHLGMVLDT